MVQVAIFFRHTIHFITSFPGALLALKTGKYINSILAGLR